MESSQIQLLPNTFSPKHPASTTFAHARTVADREDCATIRIWASENTYGRVTDTIGSVKTLTRVKNNVHSVVWLKAVFNQERASKTSVLRAKRTKTDGQHGQQSGDDA